jgi:hypothetical protein
MYNLETMNKIENTSNKIIKFNEAENFMENRKKSLNNFEQKEDTNSQKEIRRGIKNKESPSEINKTSIIENIQERDG